ncbi:hypothetical protein HZS_8110 [Henneguya salminicola]|nr:hypothetical protein HZS_8110 [Henneguya salminicola]
MPCPHNVLLRHTDIRIMCSRVDDRQTLISIFGLDDSNVEKFSTYFKKKKYSPGSGTLKDAFARRTNNNVERYHKRLTENFATVHSNLAAFVEVIRNEFKFYKERIAEIRQNGSRTRYEHPESPKKRNFRTISTC